MVKQYYLKKKKYQRVLSYSFTIFQTLEISTTKMTFTTYVICLFVYLFFCLHSLCGRRLLPSRVTLPSPSPSSHLTLSTRVIDT